MRSIHPHKWLLCGSFDYEGDVLDLAGTLASWSTRLARLLPQSCSCPGVGGAETCARDQNQGPRSPQRAPTMPRAAAASLAECPRHTPPPPLRTTRTVRPMAMLPTCQRWICMGLARGLNMLRSGCDTIGSNRPARLLHDPDSSLRRTLNATGHYRVTLSLR